MPRGDRTGPEGFGPMTGRAAGYCGGYDEPGFMDQAAGSDGAGEINTSLPDYPAGGRLVRDRRGRECRDISAPTADSRPWISGSLANRN